MVTVAGALAVWLVVMVTVGATASPRQNGAAGTPAVATGDDRPGGGAVPQDVGLGGRAI